MSSHKGKEKKFIKKPYYLGGKEALRSFIRHNKKYPPAAAQENIKGVVRIRMTIDLKGHIIRTKVIKKLGYGCDEEALRVVNLLRYQVPHTRNLKGTFHKNINIHFGPQAKKSPKRPSMQYRYTTTTAKPTPTVKTTNNISYTISWGQEEE